MMCLEGCQFFQKVLEKNICAGVINAVNVRGIHLIEIQPQFFFIKKNQQYHGPTEVGRGNPALWVACL